MIRVFSNTLTLPVLKHRAYKVTTSGTPGTAVKLEVPNISPTSNGLTRSGTTASFTSVAEHRLADGQLVTISGADQPDYNGTFKITVVSTTVFTYVMRGDPGATATGTVVATYTPLAQWALITSVAGNAAGGVTIGPDANADLDTITPGQTYTLPCPNGAKFDLSDWYVASGSASQELHILIL